MPNEENEKLTNSNEKKLMIVDKSNYKNDDTESHNGENCHSNKSKIQEELKKSHREQKILLKQNKQYIIDFLSGNKESIRIEDLKIYEPVYKCYREKGKCHLCNSLSNIICKTCYNNSHYNIKEVWLCTSHWQQHSIKEHN